MGSAVVSIFTCSCFKKRKKVEKMRTASEDIYKEFSLIQLQEFYKRVSAEYDDYKDLISTSNYNKAKFNPETSMRFLGLLKQRVINLEKVIDFHLVNLMRAASKKNLDKTEWDLLKKYKKYTSSQKLLLLLANQSKLLKLKNLDCLRMQGTTQSYHIHDSQQFIRAKQQQMRMQKEEFENYNSAKMR